MRRGVQAQVFNEMHGLIVGVGKNYCMKSKALCDECPLGEFLHHRPALPKPRTKGRKTPPISTRNQQLRTRNSL